MKQTAVEWVLDWMSKNQYFIGNDLLKAVKQAKEMEKEQIMNAFEAAEKDCGKDFLHGDLYYNETFKSE
jgi:hypothetical protein